MLVLKNIGAVGDVGDRSGDSSKIERRMERIRIIRIELRKTIGIGNWI